jgi:hypothetical protein
MPRPLFAAIVLVLWSCFMSDLSIWANPKAEHPQGRSFVVVDNQSRTHPPDQGNPTGIEKPQPLPPNRIGQDQARHQTDMTKPLKKDSERQQEQSQAGRPRLRSFPANKPGGCPEGRPCDQSKRLQ